MTSRKKISIGTSLSLADVDSVLDGNVSISIGKEILKKISAGSKYLNSVAKKEIIYGVNTGFGPMARTRINPSKQTELQYNLVRSHAVGQGAVLDVALVRAMMLIRLHTLARGFSGVSKDIIFALKNFLEKDIVPVVFEHGSVGASGDLVQLAHIALALIGEGEVVVEGQRMKTSVAFKKYHLHPVELRGRDGLALINGTACMTAIASVNLILAKKLVDRSVSTSALLLEIAGANLESLHPIVGQVRPHKGQIEIARAITSLFRGSLMIKGITKKRAPINSDGETILLNESLQEIYSLRCTPQIIGPVLDTVESATQVIETEINSVTDNPIIAPRKGIFHAGNFHGDYVALEMDKLKIAITKLSLLFERQIHFLCNPRLNEKLPPFINAGTVGLNMGFQGLQFVATSNAAENQTLSMPASIHSLPTNNDNQDIVSMGTNASLLASRVVENTFQIQAILVATLLQAVDYLGVAGKLGFGTKRLYHGARRVISYFKKDYPLYKDVGNLAEYLKGPADL